MPSTTAAACKGANQVRRRCRAAAGRAVRLQRRQMKRVNGRKETGAGRALYATRTVVVGYEWRGLDQHQPASGAAARMRRHRHVVRQRRAEGGAN
eukprot:scaffold57349_cov67-Phaeocystis_antarctica.AAC.2